MWTYFRGCQICNVYDLHVAIMIIAGKNKVFQNYRNTNWIGISRPYPKFKEPISSIILFRKKTSTKISRAIVFPERRVRQAKKRRICKNYFKQKFILPILINAKINLLKIDIRSVKFTVLTYAGFFEERIEIIWYCYCICYFCATSGSWDFSQGSKCKLLLHICFYCNPSTQGRVFAIFTAFCLYTPAREKGYEYASSKCIKF